MLHKGLVVVVDENPNTREILKRRLEPEGFQLACFSDALQADKFLQRTDADIILLEFGSKIHEQSFLSHLRSQPAFKEVPIILMGMMHDYGAIIDQTNLYAADYITKPFNGPILVRKVHDLVVWWRNRQQSIVKEEKVDDQLGLLNAIDDMQDGFLVFCSGLGLMSINKRANEFYPFLDEKDAADWKFGELLKYAYRTGIFAIPEEFTHGGTNAQQIQTAVQDRIEKIKAPESIWEESSVDGKHFQLSSYHAQDGRIILTQKDISDDKKAQRHLEYMAHHDQLTGLYNRKFFMDKLIAVMRQEHRQVHVTLLFLDLDKFKQVNDTEGHQVGDGLLIAVADRIRHNIRERDFAARFGGDEFCIALIGEITYDQLLDVVSRLSASIKTAYQHTPMIQVQVGASIGIARFPEDSQNPDELIKMADIAMYAAKALHGGYRFYRDMAGGQSGIAQQ